MKLLWNRFSFLRNAVALVVIIIVGCSVVNSIASAALAAPPQSVRALEPADMQNLIFVWASGTPSIQQQASQMCQANHISPIGSASISADVRSAWLDLMQADPVWVKLNKGV